MKWSWQQSDWPDFRWDSGALAALEAQFLQQSGVLIGSVKHLSEDDRAGLTIDIMTGEALKTSEIEGEILDRDSVQSSLRRQFGLETDARRVPPAERGIAEMMMVLYRDYAEPLDHAALYGWHRNEITGWLTYFAQAIIDAQVHSLAMIHFLLAKTKFYDRFRKQLNERQARVIARMFREGQDGFKGGLSAANYITIADTSRATATRDLQELVTIGALTQTGVLKSTRYHLNIGERR
jgi:Fic family protein